jgi:cystathionine gamma-synthase
VGRKEALVSQSPSSPKSPRRPAPDTLAVHAGEPRPKAHDSLTMPIVCAATYSFESTDELCRYFDGKYEREEYGRYGNPTVRAAEQKIAALDGAEDAALFASGMAAFTSTLLALLKSGDHVVMTSDCYRRSRQFVGTVLKRYGVTSTLVPPGDYDALEAAITPATKLVIAESPTNPYLRLVDLPRLVEVRRRHPAVKLMVDSTFATPVNQRPIEHGVDLVLHSATKYLAGHNDVLAGVISGKAPLISALHDFRGVLGGVLDAHAAYLLLRGIKTLALRVRQQNESALRIARYLEAHARVERVHYPLLESHPDYAIARSQMTGGGGVISFELKGGLEDTSRFIDACRIATIAPSLGGVETLIEQPALMSYYELSTEQRLAIGIKDNLVRLSVGIEDGEELLADLGRALEVSGSRGVSYVI